MPIYVNSGGVWKSMSSQQVNVGGVWKSVQNEYVNVAGVWKNIFSNRPTLIGTAEIISSTDQSVSGNITVPSDCTLMVATFACRHGNQPASMSYFDFEYPLGSGTYYNLSVASAFGQQSQRIGTTIYYLNNPPTGTGTLSAATNNNPGQAGYTVVYYFKNASATPIGISANTGSTSATSLTITATPSTSSPIIIACAGFNASASGSSFTNLVLAQDYLGTYSFNSGYSNTATNVSTSFTSAVTGSSADYCRMSLVEIKPLA